MHFSADHHGIARLTPELSSLLSQLRARQAFDPQAYLLAKGERLNHYLRESRLKSCLVAVSGGIDSAVVLGLVVAASRLCGSPIKRIVPVLLPVHDSDSATHQDVATRRGQEVCAAFGLKPCVIDLTSAHAVTRLLVEEAMGQHGGGWAAGQLVSYQRTPALYYITSLLHEAGTPGLLVGTTNRDEGAYLGYFGKASDGMVDLQLISDLYKSEVFSVGRALGVPSSVLQAVPTGDMYDGRTDEEVFGTSYDAVELFLRLRADASGLKSFEGLPLRDRAAFGLIARSIEALHRFNHHKYLGKSPAVHLDLWDCSLPGGWDYFVYWPSAGASAP